MAWICEVYLTATFRKFKKRRFVGPIYDVLPQTALVEGHLSQRLPTSGRWTPALWSGTITAE